MRTTTRNVEDWKRQRDAALDAWRKELRRLFELEKSQRERMQQAAADLRKQRLIVTEARTRYDRANDQYANLAQHPGPAARAHGSLNSPRANRSATMGPKDRALSSAG